MKKLDILYFASLREQRGISFESLETDCQTPDELWSRLSSNYKFKMSRDIIKVAVNDEYVDFNYALKDGDKLVFIPPVAGG